MSPEIKQALQHTKTLYLTTYSRSGKSGTVPVWFFLHQEAIYFCTLRESLKVRRIRQTGWVTLHIGRRTGPRLDCAARLLDDAPAIQALLLRTYRPRYPVRWLLLGPRLRRAFARGAETIVQLTPLGPGTPCPSFSPSPRGRGEG
jgi:PPOX class probable F420-dependent enzyme